MIILGMKSKMYLWPNETEKFHIVVTQIIGEDAIL